MLRLSLAALLLCAIAGCAQSDTPTTDCPEDMTWHAEKKACRGQILICKSSGLYQVTSGPSGITRDNMAVLSHLKSKAFDFHEANHELVATIWNNTNIVRLNWTIQQNEDDATTSENFLYILVRNTDYTISSLAVDWVNDIIYYISNQRSSVESVSWNGETHNVLVHEESETSAQWQDIVVDPYVGRLFWLDPKQVHTSNLYGANRSTFHADLDLTMEDIALDTHKELVYVIGTHKDGYKVVVRSQSDGSGATEVLKIPQPKSEIFGFGVIGSVVYWQTSFDGENVYRAEIPAAGKEVKITLVNEVMDTVSDMKVYHPDLQKPKK